MSHFCLFFDAVNKISETNLMSDISLVPRPLPDSISQPWRKIGRRSGINTASQTGNGELGFVMMMLTALSSLIATYGLHRYQVTNERCVDISGRRSRVHLLKGSEKQQTEGKHIKTSVCTRATIIKAWSC